MIFFWPIHDEFGVKRLPVVNYLIICVNVFVFLLFGFSSSYQYIVDQYGLIPSKFSWLNVFTSMFLHGGLMHLVGNMWYLYLMGDNLEDRWGHFQYFIFYLISGILAALFYVTFVPESARNIPSIGASGAISGVLGAYLILFPKSRITFWYYIFVFFRIYSGTFDIFAGFWISMWFIQQLTGMFFSMGSTYSAIAFGAHVGGFLAGIGIGFLAKAYQKVRYIQNVYQGRTALSAITGEISRKILPFEQQVDQYNTEKEIDRLLNDKNEREAAVLYGKALKNYPEVFIKPSNEYKFAEILYSIGFIDEAIDAFKRFIRKNPFSQFTDNALYNLGQIYLQKGENEKAKECFRQIVLFYPYSELQDAARYNLANILKPESVFVENKNFRV